MSADIEQTFTVTCVECWWYETVDNIWDAEDVAEEHDAANHPDDPDPDERDEWQNALDKAAGLI